MLVFHKLTRTQSGVVYFKIDLAFTFYTRHLCREIAAGRQNFVFLRGGLGAGSHLGFPAIFAVAPTLNIAITLAPYGTTIKPSQLGVIPTARYRKRSVQYLSRRELSLELLDALGSATPARAG